MTQIIAKHYQIWVRFLEEESSPLAKQHHLLRTHCVHINLRCCYVNRNPKNRRRKKKKLEVKLMQQVMVTKTGRMGE